MLLVIVLSALREADLLALPQLCGGDVKPPTHMTGPYEWRLNTKSSALRLRQAGRMHSRRNAQGPRSDLPFERISAYSETRFRTRLLFWARCHLLHSR
ncbi:hypothetical protein C7974DRAFT_397399 [Boeremia exigua]|uniref:uncharacterized protein n=1 Tax=Boeremia exigua TaxID=749465 RepID=UPI001E8CACDB|nr:uncharacterized protein C7974DRAFT_397399 [Boeremia exigua]KAH6621939.1 hypothetical protein C7974DRAFT_397399 [Boeremia exigua]